MSEDDLKQKMIDMRARTRAAIERMDEGQKDDLFATMIGVRELPEDYGKIDLVVDWIVSLIGRNPIEKGRALGRMARRCAANAMQEAPTTCDDTTEKGRPDDDQENT